MRKMCVICKKGFKTYPSAIKRGARFCSLQCFRRRKNKYQIRTCRVCSKKFRAHISRKKKRAKYLYCGLICLGKTKRKRIVVPCNFCGADVEIKRSLKKKLSHFFCGHTCWMSYRREKTKERRKRCVSCNNWFSACTTKRLKSQRHCSSRCWLRSKGATSIEIATKSALNELKVTAYSNRNPLERFVYADWWVPEKKLAIFCDGEYWHRNRARKDRTQARVLRAAGVNVLRIPEKAIKDKKRLMLLLSSSLRLELSKKDVE